MYNKLDSSFIGIICFLLLADARLPGQHNTTSDNSINRVCRTQLLEIMASKGSFLASQSCSSLFFRYLSECLYLYRYLWILYSILSIEMLCFGCKCNERTQRLGELYQGTRCGKEMAPSIRVVHLKIVMLYSKT
jgi:hypothetical protein